MSIRNRVVVTGMSGITSLGDNWQDIFNAMENKKNGITIMEEWKKIHGLHTCLGGPIKEFSLPEHYTRKKSRSMGRVSELSTVSSERALKDAKLLDQIDLITSGKVGIAYGSCSGSQLPLSDLATIKTE